MLFKPEGIFPAMLTAFDEDGTINEEVGYLYDIERLSLIPGAAGAIKRLNNIHIPAICVSNQSGVARGYFTLESVHQVHNRLEELLAIEGAHLDGIYFCPHHPKEGRYPYRTDCECRKPKTGMLKQAASDFDIELQKSYLIGDRISDIQTAKNAHLKAVLVLTGYGQKEMDTLNQRLNHQPDYVCPDIGAAVDWILKQLKGES